MLIQIGLIRYYIVLIKRASVHFHIKVGPLGGKKNANKNWDFQNFMELYDFIVM